MTTKVNIAKPNFATPDYIADVATFIALSQPELICQIQQMPKRESLELFHRLVDEEVNKELLPEIIAILEHGYSLEKMADLLDHIGDSVYVLIWGAVILQLPFVPAWNEIQRANMSKFPIHEECQGKGCKTSGIRLVNFEGQPTEQSFACTMGRMVYRNVKTGKVMKPHGFVKADIWSILYEVWTNIKLQQMPDVIIEKNRLGIKND